MQPARLRPALLPQHTPAARRMGAGSTLRVIEFAAGAKLALPFLVVEAANRLLRPQWQPLLVQGDRILWRMVELAHLTILQHTGTD